MHDISTVDGFVEITESLGEMIKYVANEPSVGLFYVQQHAHNAIPNVVGLKNKVVEKSQETNLHTEDLEDSIIMVRSMKECGFTIADDMIKDVRRSLEIMSTKQPRRGLIQASSSSFQKGRTMSWEPGTWGYNGAYSQPDNKRMSNYFSTVFKTAKERASNFKWPQLDARESTPSQNDGHILHSTVDESATISSSLPDTDADEVADELPVSSQTADDKEEGLEDEQVDEKLPPSCELSVSENYDDFKADKEAKLEEWLGGVLM
ncbi:hypothetical protein K2173_004106 [Erythroxylum novogranatense]|uniref:Uncharacterized protein n=1 Tax=Erythroxylum novogranatense TaxID=1862640 RepID=A0AAV8SXB7_9ROSI|nr:hypothetical protein K2173_004106 [Erythroxylum novogranatense]